MSRRFLHSFVVMLFFASLTGCQFGCLNKNPSQQRASQETKVETKAVAEEVTPGTEGYKWQPWPKDGSADKRFMVFYTGNVQGYVTPCGCTAEPLGGIARFGALKKQADKVYGKDKVFFVDAGDLLFEKEDDNLPADACQTKARHELLLSTYQALGLDGTLLTAKDITVRESKWVEGLMAQYGISHRKPDEVEGNILSVLKEQHVSKLPIQIHANAKDAIPLPPREDKDGLHFCVSSDWRYYPTARCEM